MWLFTKDNGHLSIGQHASDHDQLIIHAQLREDIDKFVALLNAVGGEQHEVQETAEEDHPFLVMAQRSVVAEAISQTVVAIDYDKLVQQSFHVDFGAQPGYFLWLNKTGLQVATVRS